MNSLCLCLYHLRKFWVFVRSANQPVDMLTKVMSGFLIRSIFVAFKANKCFCLKAWCLVITLEALSRKHKLKRLWLKKLDIFASELQKQKVPLTSFSFFSSLICIIIWSLLTHSFYLNLIWTFCMAHLSVSKLFPTNLFWTITYSHKKLSFKFTKQHKHTKVVFKMFLD